MSQSKNLCNDCGYSYKSTQTHQFLFNISSTTRMKMKTDVKVTYLIASSSPNDSPNKGGQYLRNEQDLDYIDREKNHLKTEVEHGSMDAILRLGYIYYYGLGHTVKDEKHAYYLFCRGAKRGNWKCYFNLALLIKRGEAVKMEKSQGDFVMKKLSSWGMAEAARFLSDPNGWELLV